MDVVFFFLSPDCDYDEAPGNCKTMCLVDSGIAFNSPYPTLLRPERKVEIILSFDFSQRDGGDTELPFKVSMSYCTLYNCWLNKNKCRQRITWLINIAKTVVCSRLQHSIYVGRKQFLKLVLPNF